MENRIKELREKNKWTQQALADEVEVTRQTIISLEKGKYDNPSILLAHRIARLLGTTIEELFLFEEE